MQYYNSMFLKNNALLTLLFCLVGTICFAQGSTSPYSILGLGKPAPVQNIRSMGMGGLGLSNGNGLYANFLNPALLPNNKLTVFEVAYTGEQKQISTGATEQNAFSANLAYLHMGFPVSNRWSMAVGIRPLTSVNYRVARVELIPQTSTFVQYEFEGSGGISQVYFSNGFRIWKGLSVGVEGQYNFGSISSDATSRLDDSTNEYIVGMFDRTNYAQLNLKAGLSYMQTVGEKHQINFGATYQPSSQMRADSFLSTQRRRLDDIKLRVDTLNFVTDRQVAYPSSYGFGVTFENFGHFVVGVDYTVENWSAYADLEGGKPLANSRRVSIGGEWTADYSSVNSYLKRVTLRAGIQHEQTPWLVEGSQLVNQMATFGITFPVMRAFSSVSFAAQYGTLRGESENIAKENYIRFNLGLTINDRWFIKRRVN